MAPDRKSDPGRLFDWKRLADRGLSVWPEPSLPGDFLRNAAAFGYPVEHGEAVILEAFRQRFRPDATGPIDPADHALMAGLARHTRLSDGSAHLTAAIITVDSSVSSPPMIRDSPNSHPICHNQAAPTPATHRPMTVNRKACKPTIRRRDSEAPRRASQA